MPVERIVETGIALAEALAAAHEKGIVHRDLKPANVMVTTDGRVKVLDFGLARVAGSSDAHGDSELSTQMRTREGVVMGTMPYMSPEQVEGDALDHRTDIFSLGVILHEMATGRRPFQGRSSADLFAAILRDAAPPVTDARADLPAGLARVVGRCLEKDPNQRIQTARDLAAELRPGRREEEDDASRILRPPPAPVHAAHRTGGDARRRRGAPARGRAPRSPSPATAAPARRASRSSSSSGYASEHHRRRRLRLARLGDRRGRGTAHGRDRARDSRGAGPLGSRRARDGDREPRRAARARQPRAGRWMRRRTSPRSSRVARSCG